MTRSAWISVVAAVFLGLTSLASARNRSTTPRSTTPRSTVADPYYRLSESYYGTSDPYHGLFDFYAVPPYSPGNAYGYV